MSGGRATPAALAAAAVLLLAFPAVSSAKRRCASPAGTQPRVSHLVASNLKCSSARKVVAAVRRSDDWRGAYYGDRLGFVSYSASGTRRKLRCNYRLHGRRRPYVTVVCRDVRNRRATVSAQLRRR